MKLIVGLGNPGTKYDLTRHNIGFEIVDNFAKKYNCDFKAESKFNALVATTIINGEKVMILKPQTYMNLSGESVVKIRNYYDIELDDMIICHDDLDLNFGNIRIKHNSSSGGQNGVKNIIQQLGTQKFTRIKVGILNNYKKDTAGFVLSKFNKEEMQQLPKLLDRCNDILDDFVNGNSYNALMNKYN